MSATPTALRIGVVEADLDGVELRGVRVDGREVVNRLYIALRDELWARVQAEVTVVERSVDGGSLQLTWDADHRPHGRPLTWRGSLLLHERGLMLSVRATAHGPLTYNRFGICVLHPLAQCGGDLVVHAASGFEIHGGEGGTLPEAVAPQLLGATGPMPAIGPFTGLDITAQGLRTRLRFAGDAFEMEDQRNWTDASLKTYSTPLELPRPHCLAENEVLEQSVGITWDVLKSNDNSTISKRGTYAVSTLPSKFELGALVPANTSVAVDSVRRLVDDVGLAFFRMESRLNSDGCDVEWIRKTSSALRLGGGEVELALLFDDHWTIEGLLAAVAAARPRTLWVFPADAESGSAKECTPADLVARVREAVSADALQVGGGTLLNFCELQRHPVDHLDALTFAVCPTVHVGDERSILETPQSVPSVIWTARGRGPDALIEVGPLVATERVPSQVANGGVEAALDPRGLPVSWVVEILEALDTAGVERVCTFAVDTLVTGGAITSWGKQVAEYSARSNDKTTAGSGGAL